MIDLGYATHFDPSVELTEYAGAPCYMAPEIILGHAYNEKVDVWSIGIIAFMLLSGEMLFRSNQEDRVINDQVAIRPIIDIKCKDISDDGKDFLEKCLQRKGQNRLSCENLLKHPWIRQTDNSAQSKLDVE